MRARRLAGIPLLLALVAGGAARAEEQGAAGPCDRLVRLNMGRMERSPVMDFQIRVQAHQITKLILDPLSQKLAAGERWREGNVHWEEAYALFQPDVLAQMKDAGAQELRRQETNLPRHLDPAVCAQSLALVASKLGGIAQSVEDASEMGQLLASFQKAFPTPPRLKPLEEKARKWIADGKALANGPEVRRQRAAFEKARAELRAHGKHLLQGLRKLGDDPGAQQQPSRGEAGAQMAARNKERLLDIVRRFREANGG